jgi:anaerobic magnesium-protoporphyrin IX monomethyl ester cyclase
VTDLLLGQSYFLRFDPKLWQAMHPYPPLGTLYAASYIRSRGYEVSLFDAMLAESEAFWERALQRERPRIAVLFEDSFNYLSKMSLLRMRQAALAMIEMARQHTCTVIVAGSDASDHPETYLGAGADFVITGEGELTLGELVDTLSGRAHRPLTSVQGLAFLDDDRLVRTEARPPMRDLDTLPFPAWDLVDVERYRSVWLRRHGRWSVNMVTTRGCPYHCNWCSKPIWGQTYHARSPENVVAELEWLKDTYRPDHVGFADDILGLKPGWLDRFAELLDQTHPQLPFKCLCRADLLLRPQTVEALRRAGCEMVWIGAESGSQRVLDAMEKGIYVDQVYEAARKLREAGIRVGFFLQFGYPGEEFSDIEATLRMVRDFRPDDIGVSVSYPLPGTPFFDRVRDQLQRENWIDSSDLAMLYEGPYTTVFYRRLHGAVHREFRARKYLGEFLRLARHPGRMRPRHLRRAATGLAYWLRLQLVDRPLLKRLARRRSGGIGRLPVRLETEAAATPSPQT